ncbi:MAG: HPr family phosphocarrier protein [Natronospirillum sp.]
MIKTTITVSNKAGLHARTAAKLVSTASAFTSTMEIGNEEKMVDAKSILAIMLLAAGQGSELDVIIDGPDEEEALKAIQALVESRFGEE